MGAVIQYKGATVDDAASADLSFDTLPVVGHDILVVPCRYAGAGMDVTPTDNQDNTGWAQDEIQPDAGGNTESIVLWRKRVTQSAGTFTVSYAPGSGSYFAWGILEAEALTGAPGVGAKNINNGSDDSPTTGSMTPATTDSLIVGAMAHDGTTVVAQPDGFTSWYQEDDWSHQTLDLAFLTTTSASAVNPAWALNVPLDWRSLGAIYAFDTAPPAPDNDAVFLFLSVPSCGWPATVTMVNLNTPTCS